MCIRDRSFTDKDVLHPDNFCLRPVYPNPFNPETQFSLLCSSPGIIQLNVFNIQGKLVTRLYTGFLDAGEHHFSWDGKDKNGKGVSSGVYIIQAQQSKRTVRQKAVLIR